MTIPDPFAEAPAEPTAPVEETPAVGTAYVDVKPRFAEDFPSESKIVLTFKEGTGFDSSWIVVHAGTVAEADALLDQSFADLMAKTKKVAAHFRGGSPTPGTGARVDTRQAPQGATSPPSWFPAPPAPDWVYKTGFKNGKVWHAWAPAQKGQGEWQFHRQP